VPPTSITQTAGIGTVTAIGTNSFDVNIPSPVYNATTGVLNTGTAVTNITPTLALTGNTMLTVGPATNTLLLPPTVLTQSTNITVQGTYPNFTLSSVPI
jgi:hypothetical protein